MKTHPDDRLIQDSLSALAGEHGQLFEHLLICDACRHRFLPLLRQQPSRLAERLARELHLNGDPSRYKPALIRSQQAHERRAGAFLRERAEASGLLQELIVQPTERRHLILDNHRRFHTWGLLELLIEAGRLEVRSDSQRSGEMFDLALRLADRLDPEVYGADRIEDLRARAWAGIANRRRMGSDLRGAQAGFEKAFTHLRQGTGDLLERAIILDLKSSLLRAQRQLDSALRLLRRAHKIFLEYGDTHRAGRALLNMESVYHAAGTPEEGIPLLYEAMKLVDPDEEPYVVLCLWHNLIDDLAEAGRAMEAQGLFIKAQPIYRKFSDTPTQNRRKWVSGKIARGLGQLAEAESLFLSSRDGFIAVGVPYETALVSLDLASLYAEQGRAAELKTLAESILPIFVCQGIHREALAAMLFLRQAIVAECASRDLVTRIAVFLKRSQHDPELRFEAP